MEYSTNSKLSGSLPGTHPLLKTEFPLESEVFRESFQHQLSLSHESRNVQDWTPEFVDVANNADTILERMLKVGIEKMKHENIIPVNFEAM